MNWVLSLLLVSQIQIVRVKYNGGDWYNDPSIIPNMLREFQKRTGIETSPREVVLSLHSPEIFFYPFLFITGHGKINLSEEEIKNLRKYLYSGGFVYADDDYGMDEYFRRLVAKAFPESKLILLP
ncbi:MAG TPA: DUF4159 domain-containing protein, partial [candidate division WOR-3 bacterium]|nr:DUF4159 domain-containing protein [candidate division WOR-3 bacterium]